MQSPCQRFKALQQQLHQLLKGQSFDEELVQKRMTKYIALMVEDNPDQQERMFDHFCEFGGVDVLTRLMHGDPLIAVKCYSLLFINLRNEMWTSFILCQSFLMDAISLRAPSADEEYTEYFVSFLKSLSIRINQSQVTLFYNKRNCTFPLAMAAMHYHNHPDFMVRTSVMNILLELMKIQEPKTRMYFSRFPFTSYLVAFACEVSQLVASFYVKLADPTLPTKHLTNYKVDLADYLYYFNDLVQYATPTTIQVIEQIVTAYFIIPTFKKLLSEQKRERKHALLLVLQGLRVIKNKIVLQAIALLLFKPKISSSTLKRIQLCEQVYLPQNFKKEFDPTASYWCEHQQSVIGHCLQVFRDIQKFDVSYEQTKHEASSKFIEQVGRISQFIGYDLLQGKILGSLLREQLQENSETVQNPFKVILMQFLRPSLPHQHTLITAVFLNIVYNPNISQRVKQICELKIGTKNNSEQKQKFLNGFGTKLMIDLKECLIDSIRDINWEQTRLVTLSNTLKLLQMLMLESQQIQFEEDLLKDYREVTGRLRQYAKSDHMFLFVDNFALKQAQIRDNYGSDPCEMSLPYPPFFMSQDKWDDHQEYHAIPTKTTQKITHLIQHFFLFRSFVTKYFIKFYQAQYTNFHQEYAGSFLSTISRWPKGEHYRITGRPLNCCMLQSADKKNKKAMIIQDQYSFVLGELSDKGCKILVNQVWKNMTFEISKEDGTWVEVSLGSGKDQQRYKLIFEDQVRSGTTLVRLNDIKWECSQCELSFIAKFLKAAAAQ